MTFMTHTAPAELRAIGSMAVRVGTLVGRLEKFSFPLVAAPLAGLLTRSENHTAAARIEALIHLAVLACQGDRKPGVASRVISWRISRIISGRLTLDLSHCAVIVGEPGERG